MKLKVIGIILFSAVLCLGAFAAPTPSAIFTSSTAATERTTPLAVGAAAPDFTLPDIDGKEVSLASLREKMPVVVVFYRGSWCPFCARQLSELRSLAATTKNARIVAISVDAPAATKKFAAKIAADGKGEVTFPMLADTDHKIIDAYGLHDPNYDGKQFDGIPHPAVYIIGQDGKIAWAHVSPDYRQRPSNDDIRAALEAIK